MRICLYIMISTIANKLSLRRYHYRACIQKTGWDKYFPVDPFNNAQYKALAQKHYEQLYTNFAEYVSPP